MKEKVYAKINQLPRGKASQNITEVEAEYNY